MKPVKTWIGYDPDVVGEVIDNLHKLGFYGLDGLGSGNCRGCIETYGCGLYLHCNDVAYHLSWDNVEAYTQHALPEVDISWMIPLEKTYEINGKYTLNELKEMVEELSK